MESFSKPWSQEKERAFWRVEPKREGTNQASRKRQVFSSIEEREDG